MRFYSEFPPIRLAPVVAGVLLAVLMAGCATTGSEPRPVEQTAAGTVDRPGPKVETDGELGFTVTEVVEIGSDVQANYHAALLLLQQERLSEGVALLERVVESAPGLTAPHVDLGVAYGRLGRDDEALEELEAAIALAPTHPVALNEVGIVYRRTGRFDAARASYEQALGILPRYHLALRNLGVLCDLYLDDLPCALANYEAYAEIVTDDQEVGIWIADIRNRLDVAQ